MALAKRLQDFWQCRRLCGRAVLGRPVAERFAKNGTYELYRVASNLVNGMPPQYRGEPGKR
jgi:hypothetical protein